MDSDFAGLKLTNHLLAHRLIFSISEFNIWAASAGLSTIMYRLVSSVKRRILQ